MSFNWTPARVEKLCALWGDKPTSAIAAALGTTKGSVIGKADRLGLPPYDRAVISANLSAIVRKQLAANPDRVARVVAAINRAKQASAA